MNLPSKSLRRRILAYVSALVLVSLLGSTLSLFRIAELNRKLVILNENAMPLGRVLSQMERDSEVYYRETEKRLGHAHWTDPHWKPVQLPSWIVEVVESAMDRANTLLDQTPVSGSEEIRTWLGDTKLVYLELKKKSDYLLKALELHDQHLASDAHAAWSAQLDRWMDQVRSGVSLYDRSLKRTFSEMQDEMARLKRGLQIILLAFISLSLLMLWMGQRALTPLQRLAWVVRKMGEGKIDQSDFNEWTQPNRKRDEVSELGSEFARLAENLTLKGQIVEAQKKNLENKNIELESLGELNRNIIGSIQSILLVADLNGVITQANRAAGDWLGCPVAMLMGTRLTDWRAVKEIPGLSQNSILNLKEGRKIPSFSSKGRIFTGAILALVSEQADPSNGFILVLDDQTEEAALKSRLDDAEKLATVGRLSAQVAHEVRNPLHAIGLEAEIGLESMEAGKISDVRSSLVSILSGVDRLEKITDNYLRFSKLSSGKRERFDAGEAIDEVLATYSNQIMAAGVQIDWRRFTDRPLIIEADRELLIHGLGNLVRNSLQAFDEGSSTQALIRLSLGDTESGKVWLRIEDNGPGIGPEAQEKLFKPFFTTKAQGTGLGLSFVQKVVSDHGGALEWIPGPTIKDQKTGTTFQITLPQFELPLEQEETRYAENFISR